MAVPYHGQGGQAGDCLFVEDHPAAAGDLEAVAMVLMLDHHLAGAGEEIGTAHIADAPAVSRCLRCAGTRRHAG